MPNVVGGAAPRLMTHDIVVVGAGLAGLCAALAAAERGDRVLVLEKTAEIGGSSIISGGGIAFAGTDTQDRLGVRDTVELIQRDLREAGNHANDERLISAYVSKQLDTYWWLRAVGVQFSPTSLQAGGGNSVPRLARLEPRQMFQALTVQVARWPNCAIETEVAGFRLLVGGRGEVIGIRAQHLDRWRDHFCKKAIVLATGGFSRNKELVALFAPEKVAAQLIGGDGATGDGLKMAWKLGAGLSDIGYIKGSFGSHVSSGGREHRIMMPIYKGGIIVNKRGDRFVNESLLYKDIGDACLLQPDAVGFQIFDRNVMDKSDPDAVTYDFDRARRAGLMFEAADLPELAQQIEVEPGKLSATVAAYNAGVRKLAPDAFGRSHLPPANPLLTIEAPPFYAYPSTTAISLTNGGITIDGRAQVLDVFGEPIPGLLAAGEVTGGFHGASYLSGTGLGKAAVFGRIAGLAASSFGGREKNRTPALQ